MPTYISPAGNPEVWDAKPEGYCNTWEEWLAAHPPTPEEMQKRFTDAIQEHLDTFARTRNYDGIMSAATYATSTIRKFRLEGQYAVEIRDATWAAAYAVLAEVQAGLRPMPDVEEVMAELPALAWPTDSPSTQ